MHRMQQSKKDGKAKDSHQVTKGEKNVEQKIHGERKKKKEKRKKKNRKKMQEEIEEKMNEEDEENVNMGPKKKFKPKDASITTTLTSGSIVVEAKMITEEKQKKRKLRKLDFLKCEINGLPDMKPTKCINLPENIPSITKLHKEAQAMNFSQSMLHNIKLQQQQRRNYLMRQAAAQQQQLGRRGAAPVNPYVGMQRRGMPSRHSMLQSNNLTSNQQKKPVAKKVISCDSDDEDTISEHETEKKEASVDSFGLTGGNAQTTYVNSDPKGALDQPSQLDEQIEDGKIYFKDCLRQQVKCAKGIIGPELEVYMDQLWDAKTREHHLELAEQSMKYRDVVPVENCRQLCKEFICIQIENPRMIAAAAAARAKRLQISNQQHQQPQLEPTNRNKAIAPAAIQHRLQRRPVPRAHAHHMLGTTKIPSGYDVYAQSVRNALPPNSGWTHEEIMKQIYKQWNELTEKSKAPYVQRAHEISQSILLNQRQLTRPPNRRFGIYANSLASKISIPAIKQMSEKEKFKKAQEILKELQTKIGSKPTKKINLKDANAPKRPISAYVRYGNMTRDKVRKEMAKGTPTTKIQSEIAKRWKTVNAKIKQKLTNEYTVEMKEYQKHLAEYEQTPVYRQFLKKLLMQELKLSKPPPKVKKPSSAYHLYFKDVKEVVKRNLLPGVGLQQEIAKLWDELPSNQRVRYEAESSRLKANFVTIQKSPEFIASERIWEYYEQTSTIIRHLLL